MDPHILEVLENQQPPPNLTDAPQSWYSSLLGLNGEISISNNANIPICFHIFGSTEKFEFGNSLENPLFYKMELNLLDGHQRNIKTLSNVVTIIVTHIENNDLNQIVRLMSRDIETNRSFNIFQRHIEAGGDTLPINDFNNDLIERFGNYSNVPIQQD